jgi:hypothetical protein
MESPVRMRCPSLKPTSARLEPGESDADVDVGGPYAFRQSNITPITSWRLVCRYS